MYLLGHSGLTATAARSADEKVDLRLVALLSILPDLIDKPGSLLWSSLVNHNTRGLGHTGLGALVVLILLLCCRARRPFLLWCCYAGHLLLDRMWMNDNPVILFWPLLGPFPRPTWGFLERKAVPYNLFGEALGLLLWLRLIPSRRFK